MAETTLEDGLKVMALATSTVKTLRGLGISEMDGVAVGAMVSAMLLSQAGRGPELENNIAITQELMAKTARDLAEIKKSR